jgi:hypothetical protein
MSRSDPLDFPQTVGFWFDADLYAKLTATWWEIFTTGVTYTYYASPNDSFSTYPDVGLSFSLNDAKWLGDLALNPSLLFAFETRGEALAAQLSDHRCWSPQWVRYCLPGHLAAMSAAGGEAA